MKLWDEILRWFAGGSREEDAEQGPEHTGPWMEPWETFGAHMYRSEDEDPSVMFTNRARGIRRIIVDKNGYICDFPGVDPETMKKLKHISFNRQIRFRTDFSREPDGRILMIWEIQPDGRYWEDEDGYGGTNDEEICLYTMIDEKGCYTGPFKLYSWGNNKYFNRQMTEEE